jgi:hypothetical protein
VGSPGPLGCRRGSVIITERQIYTLQHLGKFIMVVATDTLAGLRPY